MGTSSASIFQDDVARDVREQFLELLRHSRSTESSANRLIEHWRSAVDDRDDGPVFWIALAATQWEYGCLRDDIQQEAIRVIDDESDLARWPEKLRERRRRILAELRVKLLSAQPPARYPRKRKEVEPSPKLVAIYDEGQARADAFSLDGDVTVQVSINRRVGASVGGGSVFTASCSLKDIELHWLQGGTLQITYPSHASVTQRAEQHFFCGVITPITYPIRS